MVDKAKQAHTCRSLSSEFVVIRKEFRTQGKSARIKALELNSNVEEPKTTHGGHKQRKKSLPSFFSTSKTYLDVFFTYMIILYTLSVFGS